MTPTTSRLTGPRAMLAGLSMFFLVGCVNKDAPDAPSAVSDSDTEFNWIGMLANYADNILLPQYTSASDAALELSSPAGELATYCQQIGGEQEAAARSAAQQSWREMMTQWQGVELMQVGPLIDSGGALRNRIYSYGSSAPLSSCAVDQSVVLAQEEGFDIRARSVNSRGLAALEYLLFNDELSHTCPSQITQTQDWNERDEIQRKQWRCDYAAMVAQDIAEAAAQLLSQWQSDDGNYRYRFVNPGDAQAQINQLSDAIFYIETETKDLKLGVSTGIHAECPQTACPDAVESRYSESSLANIRENLLTFEQLLMGGEGLGFDDVITRAGFAEVVNAFRSDVSDAIAIIDNSSQSLYQQVQMIVESEDSSACANSAANPDADAQIKACALHGVLKRITDRLRTDFVTIVNLDLPDRAQSDND